MKLSVSLLILSNAATVSLAGSPSTAEIATLLRSKVSELVPRRKLAACDGWTNWDCQNGDVCAQATPDAEGFECLAPRAEGAYCGSTSNGGGSNACAFSLRCYDGDGDGTKECAAKASAGGKCDPYDESNCMINILGGEGTRTCSSAGAFPSNQCPKGQYCVPGVDGETFQVTGTCSDYAAIGDPCGDADRGDKFCDPSKALCDTVGGVNTCQALLKNGDTCGSDQQCGGSNPPYSAGFCSDTEKTCGDTGEVLAAVATGIFSTILIIIIIGVCCCCAIIYFACAGKKKVVVVQS